MTNLEKIQQFEDFDKAVEEKQFEKPEVKFIVNMPFENFKNYSESTIEATFEQFDKLSCKLALKLNNNRTFFDPYLDFHFSNQVYII